MGIVAHEDHPAGRGAAITCQRHHSRVGRDGLAERPIGLRCPGGTRHIDGASVGNRHTGPIFTYANGFGIGAVRRGDQICRAAAWC